VTVLLLTGFLATILMRVLKNDFVKWEEHFNEYVIKTCLLCCLNCHFLIFWSSHL
jgi:hypothetical protein